MHILMLATRNIYPIDAGFKKRIYHSGLALSKKHRVDLLILDSWKGSSSYPFSDIFEFPMKGEDRIKGILSTYLLGHPLQSGYFFNPKALTFIKETQKHYDMIWIHHIRFSPYIPHIKKPFVIDFHDSIALHYLQSMKYVQSSVWKFIYKTEYPRLKRLEVLLSKKAYKSITVSHIDSEFIYHNGGVYPTPIPMGINPKALEEPFHQSRENIITFIGKLSYLPNKEGLLWYIRNIHYRVFKKYQTKLVIIGSGKEHIENEISNFSGIELAGFVDNPYNIMAKARLNIAPVFIGAGIQNKILEGLAVGTPTITTPLGARPIHPKLRKYLFIGENISEWLNIIDRIIQADHWDKGQTTKKLMKQYYSWEKIHHQMVQIIT